MTSDRATATSAVRLGGRTVPLTQGAFGASQHWTCTPCPLLTLTNWSIAIVRRHPKEHDKEAAQTSREAWERNNGPVDEPITREHDV